MTCPAPKHGTAAAWQQHRCSCPAAREAYNREQRIARKQRQAGRPRLIDAAPSQRQVRDLMAAGWRACDIATRIGWSSGELHILFTRGQLQRRTAERIHAVYLELHTLAGPSEQTRRRAARADWWLPPLTKQSGDVDQVAIDRALAGDTVRLNRAERREAIRQGRAAGLVDREIAERVGVDVRNVQRAHVLDRAAQVVAA